MSEEPESNQRSAQAWGNYVLGLLVFLLGIGLMLLAFYSAYGVLGGLDTQLNRVEMAKAAVTPATPAPPVKAKPGQARPAPEVVQAQPDSGPGLGLIAAGTGLRLVALLVLAGMAAMIASRGAQLAGMGTR